jgi:hypothetical protein
MKPSIMRPPIHSKFVRPAFIQIRFSDAMRYTDAVKAFSQVFTQPIPPGTLPTNSKDNSDRDFTFPVGSQPIPAKKDIGLSILLRSSDSADLRNKTIVYWAVAGKRRQDLVTAQQELLSNLPGYKVKEGIRLIKDSIHPVKNNIAGGNREQDATEVSIIGDDAGALIGLLVNPPYPHGTGIIERNALRKYLLPLAAFIVGLAFVPLSKEARKLFTNSR